MSDVFIPQPHNYIGEYANLLQLKNMAEEAPLRRQALQQQVQTGQMQNQVVQREIDSQNAIMDAWSNSGGDLSKAYSTARQSGKVLPGDLAKLQQANLQIQTEALNLLKAKGERAVQEADWMDGAVDAVKAATPDQRPAVYQQQLASLAQQGVDVSQAPPEYPGDQAFTSFGLGIKSHKVAMEQAAKQAEIDKNKAQTAEAQAATQQKQTETNWYAQNGGAPGVSAEAMQQSDWLKKNPGKGPSDFLKWKAQNSPMAIMGMSNMFQGPGGQDALDLAADLLLKTGQFPQGINYRSPESQAAVWKRAAELNQQRGGGSLADNKAVYRSLSDSLDQLQKNYTAVGAFEDTANKNIAMLKELAAKVPDMGTRYANIPVRLLSGSMLGTANMAAFKTALAPVQAEAAKILNSANLTGQLTDASRKEMQDLVDGNMTYSALVASLDTLQREFGNRLTSYGDAITTIKGQIGNVGNNGGGGSGTIKVGSIITQGGHKYKVTAVDANGKPTAADPVQ